MLWKYKPEYRTQLVRRWKGAELHKIYRLNQCYLTTNSFKFYEVANSYKFELPQWRVGLGAGLGVGHSYKFGNS